MSHDLARIEPWLMRFRALLLERGYSQSAIEGYSNVARDFLGYLARRGVAITAAGLGEVAAFLRARLRQYRRRHGRDPRSPGDWQSPLTAPVHTLLRLAQGHWPPPSPIAARLAWFRSQLVEAHHTPGTVRRYLQVARHFLTYLDKRAVAVEAAQPADVSRFLARELAAYFQSQGRPPHRLVDWRCGLTAGVHALLHRVQGEWPPPAAVHPWLRRLRQHLQQAGLVPKTRLVYLHACRAFLAYLEARGLSVEAVTPPHVEAYRRRALRAYRQRHGEPPKDLLTWRRGLQAPLHRLLRLVQGAWPPEARPDPSIAAFRDHLVQAGFRPSVIPNSLAAVRGFLRFLRAEHLAVGAVCPGHVAAYLDARLAAFHHRHQREPANLANWRHRQTGPIHRYLRLLRGQWPPEAPVADALEARRRALGDGYRHWLHALHGLSPETLRKNGHAAQVFLRWLGERAWPAPLRELTVADLDAFLAWRNRGLRRATRSGVSQGLRSFLRYLYGAGCLAQDLAPHVPPASHYRLEVLPAALSGPQLQRLLAVTRADRRPSGLRDYAILLLIKTYGLRAGEVVRLRLPDIDWRRDRLHIQQSKTRAALWLPLMPAVGEALLDYLRHGRPASPRREVFLRCHAPVGPFGRGSSLHGVLTRRLAQAGIAVAGRHGPHALRYARAGELLRAAVPLKAIGDLLGHRSARSTEIYLKLATDDLRAIALEVPGGARP